MPEFGRIQLTSFQGRSNFHGWDWSFSKRMSNRWQASATYTLSNFSDADSNPFAHAIVNRPPCTGRRSDSRCNRISAPSYAGRDRSASSRGVQRDLEVGYGLQVSGLYFLRFKRAAQHQLWRRRSNEGVASSARFRPDGHDRSP